MKTKRILTMMAAMLLVMSAWAQSNNELLKGNKKSRKVMAVYDGINKYYQDDCPSMRPTGYYVYTLRGTKMKEDFGQSLGIDASTFSEHFEDPVRDSQLDFQQYEEDESGNFVARTNDKYIGHLIVYEDGDLQWRMADADVQKLYERWNQETYKNTEKTYELSVAFKFEDIHGSQSHYDDIFVVFTTSVTFKPFSYVPINVRVDWSNAKINKYWYAKNSTDNGSDEVHITVPPTSADYSSETNYLLSNAFINNVVVSRSIITGNIGFNYNNYNYRLIFHESNNGKKFKGTDGKTYVLRVSDDGRTLLVGTHEIAKLVIPAMFADKEGTTEEANYTTIEYQQSDIAQALLNYCSHEDFKNNNQEKLNNFLNVVVSIAIQNGDYCKPLSVENQSFNVRFIPITQEESVEGKQIFYLKDLFKSDGNEEITSITIPALTDYDNLSDNRDIQTNLNDRIKPLYQITRLFNLTYHENATLGNYIEYNQSGGFVVQKFNVVIPVEVEYVGGNIVKTTVTLTIGSDDATAKLLLNAENFPDANFRAALATILGISEGDEITEAKIAATTSLKVNRKSIADLTGIEHFTALTRLDCYDNQLTSLDVSQNTALTELYCHSNQLTSLDVSKNTALTWLECGSNQLTALDVSKNTALEVLYCYSNQLTALDVSKNTALTRLNCFGNQLTSLDVSKNTALTRLYCNYNQLTALDVSKNTALTYLQCGDNQLTSLDVSKNTALTYLDCDNNQLTSLDVSKNTALTGLRCSSNQIKGAAMDALVASLPTVSKGSFYVIDTKDENEGNVCTKSQVAVAKGKGWTVVEGYYPYPEYEGSDDATAKLLLNAANFPDANFRAALASILKISEGDEITAEKIAAMTSLDVSKSRNTPAEEKIADLTGIEHFTALTYLNCRYNQLTSLDVSKNTALTNLNCEYNRLTSLDVSKNTKLLTLYCYSNQLTSLDVSNNTALRLLYCYSNQLTLLDVTKNIVLTHLECDDNQLTLLDTSNNTALADLRCSSNRLTTLNVLNNTALESLSCYENQLTALDVSNNIALKQLWCYNNQLTALDVSGCSALTTLRCYDNQLTSLDVSGCTALTELLCHNNQLTALDVSKNTALIELWCYSNQIKGEAMDVLVASLPTVSKGSFYVINTKDTNEGNVCTKSQVAVAKGKGWTVYDYNGSYSNRQEYEGSDDATAKLLLNAENFPDANFRTALASILKISEGDEITAEKIAATTELDVSRYGKPDNEKIADLTGIEHFTALTSLDCNYNNLTSLDLSKNTALTYLGCYDNQLTSLNVFQNTEIKTLYCWGNKLESLDVSKIIALETLWCDNNQLTLLDVTHNTALRDIGCANNKLTSLDVSKNTALAGLGCGGNQLTSLDVSKNVWLWTLNCSGNQISSLDVSKNTRLNTLYCNSNPLKSLDLSNNTALKTFRCYDNGLTSLDVSKNTALTTFFCHSNLIKGSEMDALVASLPTVSKGSFYVIDTKDENEGNICTKAQVAVAKGKGWTVYDYNGTKYQEYEGSDPVAEDIDPVDEDDNIDFGTDMNDGDDLNGNVIGDIYYNINTGDGGYDAAEGCIVVKKPTDDGTVGELEGKDIFGEDFKSQFTGIVFKVPAGKGTIKVNAETTGNMLLKVKIGSNDPVEMELNGKLKVTFPYNVSETTYVYIYAGAANEAKGFGAPTSGDAALKIYGIEFIRDNTPTDINSVDSGELTVDSWYTIDGKKLAGEPKEKGIYIRNGRKVVK